MMALPEPPKSRSVPLPSRNPIPLSAAQEAQVKELYYKRVRGHCADQIRDFAACASGRTFSATWKCRQERLSMNGCMMAHAGQQEEDLAREEYFATADQRKAEREEKERKKAEQEKFFREWWDLDEKKKAQRKSRPS